jgi:hypothetical protein
MRVPPHPGTVATYRAETPYQRGIQSIQVLLPSDYTAARAYRVLYVLPVEARQPLLFGDGLAVMQSIKAHDTYDLIVVQMSFQDEPWFGDHATDLQLRQASYLKEYVVPFVEQSYSVTPVASSRLLIGFSKSGWGAFSLVMKNPDFYGYAAAWDSPLMFDTFNYGMQSIFGTQAQLDSFRPDLLAMRNAGSFKGQPRMVLAGENLWGNLIPPPTGTSHTVQYHLLLDSLGLSYVYDDNTPAPHNWNETWARPTLERLMSIVK